MYTMINAVFAYSLSKNYFTCKVMYKCIYQNKRPITDSIFQNTPHTSHTPHFLFNFYICIACATPYTHPVMSLFPILSYTTIFTSAINYKWCNANIAFASIPVSIYSSSLEPQALVMTKNLILAFILTIHIPISSLRIDLQIDLLSF